MKKYLEDQLLWKTKDSQNDILYAQWNYDKKLIPLALASIANIFPHYSLHDESHSISILNNIVRIIGKENIEKFSAIDIWLLLEASYLHDIGMVISGDALKKSIESDEFIIFFKDLLKDKNNSLYESANLFEIKEHKLKFKNEYFSIDMYESIKFLLAEYFRKNHSERSKEIIVNPSEKLSLLSPRSIIPDRIFKLLSEICSCHTKEFSEILKLPFSEVGIDVEDAHPRFISCLLRVGDLLDLDSNRFSEVMLRTLNTLPLDTLVHKSKHLSIETFRADKIRIEIIAKCLDYDTASITQHWFNYLNTEISNQMINWNDIVPNKDIGYLPTIGNLKVELINYDFIDGKNKPRFSVDTDKALSLLQGAGLYEGAYQCIREILQNSVDACLLRMWYEYHENHDFTIPNSEDFIKHVSEYPINVFINKKGIVDNYQNWEIIIEDKGIGISTDDLKYLMSTGSSSKNIKKNSVIDLMPIWMRPSGIFGIGFQSIFMLTDSVKIETKSFINEEFQIIELNKPNSKKNGDILIQKNKTTHAKKPGVKLIIQYKIKAEPGSITIRGDQWNANRIVHSYDPFSHDSMDIEIGKIIDEVFSFSEKSYFPIRLTIDNDKIPLKFENGKQFKFYDVESNLEFNIYTKNQNYTILTYYKNQHAENSFIIHFLGFEINIHKNNANEVLTLNRNKLKSDYSNKLFFEILIAVFKKLISNFDDIFISAEEKCFGSMFLNYYSEFKELSQFDVSKFTHWEKFLINIDKGDNYELKILLEKINSLKLIYVNQSDALFSEKYIIQNNDLDLEIHIPHRPHYDFTIFLLFKASLYFKSISKIEYLENGNIEITFIKIADKNNVTLSDIAKIITKHKKLGFYTRAIIPCLDCYSDLRLKDGTRKSYIHHYNFDENIYIPIHKMISPYIRSGDERYKKLEININDRLIDWVFENRYNPEVSKEMIKNTYDKFIKDVNNIEPNILS